MYLSGIWTLHKNDLSFYYKDALIFPIDFKALALLFSHYIYILYNCFMFQ